MRSLLVTGCAIALAGIASAQNTCACEPIPEQPTPTSEPTPEPTPEVPPEDPCLGPEPRPWYCVGEPTQPTEDPCLLPDGDPGKPWYCAPTTYPEEGEPTFQAYTDDLTGLTFGQYNAQYYIDERAIKIRIANPSAPSEDGTWDPVIQIVAPNEVGWAAVAWGGTMTGNPITVAWANCSNVVVSSRWASERVLPEPYAGASYEKIEAGTFINESHWQFTAKCTGCTSWTGYDGSRTSLDPTTTSSLAWAMAYLLPVTPASNTSAFGFHDVHANWDHDFAVGSNANFNEIVSSAIAVSKEPTPTVEGECIYTQPAHADGTVTVTVTATVTEATATVTETATVTAQCS